MKHYQQQESGELTRVYMQQTGHVCQCCESYLHTHEEEGGHSIIDGDVECPKCGQLCGCKCHRREPTHSPEPPTAPVPVFNEYDDEDGDDEGPEFRPPRSVHRNQ